MKSDKKQRKTLWHRLLGRLLEELLVPTGILVYTDIPVMGEPPEADILLLRKTRPRWTEEQRSRLPDGIRDSRATHILIEFKYTESVNRDVLLQTLSYDYHYKNSQRLGANELRTFLVSSRTPRRATLEKFGWHPADKPGIYKSRNPLAESVTLLLLNELADTPHNAWLRCFASRKQEKKSAFATLMGRGFSSFSHQLQWFLEGLLHHWFATGGENMETEITPDDVMWIGKKWQQAVLSGLRPEERLAGLTLKDRLDGLTLRDRLDGLTLRDVLAEFSPEEIEAYLKKMRKTRQK